jgi:hypothetical protein
MGESPEKWLNEMETEPRDVPPRQFQRVQRASFRFFRPNFGRFLRPDFGFRWECAYASPWSNHGEWREELKTERRSTGRQAEGE